VTGPCGCVVLVLCMHCASPVDGTMRYNAGCGCLLVAACGSVTSSKWICTSHSAYVMCGRCV
jgi:hypothetical protein